MFEGHCVFFYDSKKSTAVKNMNKHKRENQFFICCIPIGVCISDKCNNKWLSIPRQTL